ncbi:hypothetical protein UB51_09900 [Paenibacillus sp. IHBB 10380]|nr:hypothetical protein UB51_09900 [Paenibacillus sp. IHBB 10380]
MEEKNQDSTEFQDWLIFILMHLDLKTIVESEEYYVEGCSLVAYSGFGNSMDPAISAIASP